MTAGNSEDAKAPVPQTGEPTPAIVTLAGDERPRTDMSHSSPAVPAGGGEDEEEDEPEKKHSTYSILMMSVALMSAIFLVALDVNILGRCLFSLSRLRYSL